MRQQDLVRRHGREGFVLALAVFDTETARPFLDAMRARLDGSINVAGPLKFTVSFGVVEALDQEDLPTLINRAAAAVVASSSTTAFSAMQCGTCDSNAAT